ncbi:hypothetical protein Dimus_037897 [Dionaea muscipula]
MSQKGLAALGKQGILKFSTPPTLKFCDTCVMGKQTRLCFDKGMHLSKNCLDYIHADLWGPEKTVTPAGNRFFLSIVDDFSRKVWIYLLKSKDQTFEKFKEWKNLVENQKDRKIKVLRTDNGLEFCNVLFDDFCKHNGIERHRIIIKTPQQNGIAERMNRTLLEKVRCLLFTASLPKCLWGEALNTAAYLINRSSSTALNFKCPEEVWNDRLPSLNHLRIFGCAAFMHKSDGKLNTRSVKCVFMGYVEGTKGFKLWEKGTAGFRMLVSRDVVFNENEFPCKADNKYHDSIDDIVAADFPSTDQSVDNRAPHIEVEHAIPLDREGSHATSQVEEGVTATLQEVDGIPSYTPSDDEVAETTTDDIPTESSSQTDLGDYQLIRDRERRAPKPNPKYSLLSYADLIYTALVVVVMFKMLNLFHSLMLCLQKIAMTRKLLWMKK